MNESPAIFSPTDGLTLHAFGETVIVKVSGEETGGEYSLALVTTPPGGGPPPHVHHREDETFFILDGRYEFLLNGAWTEVAPGATVYGPKDHVHTYRNIGETDA